MTSVVLDCGALIALERNDRAMWTVLRLAALRRSYVLVPSTALAQAWRGRSSQTMLARALQQCVIAPFDPLARLVGELCGDSRTNDICDAHVAVVAATRADVLYTSDPRDMARLIPFAGPRRPTVILC